MSTTATSSPSPSTSATSLPDLLGKFSLLPRADIILRSSDSHDFPVQKLYVVDSSPVLEEQIMAATCLGVAPCEAMTMGGENREIILPVVQLPESHAILSSLLTFVFPILPVLPPTIELILELISVAEKYEMTTALIRIRDYTSRRDPPFICPETALDVYSLARKYGLLKETLEALEETLKFPMAIQDLEDKLDIVPGVALYGLWKYRQRILEILGIMLTVEFPDTELYQILSDADLDCEEINESAKMPLWLDHYLDSVIDDPSCADLTTFHLARSSHVSPTDTSSDGCEHCASISGETIHKFWTALTAIVREGIRIARSDFLLIEGEIHFETDYNPATKEAPPLPEGLNMQGADVILQSSDLVFFRVHKSILAISSPFFDDLFSLPQPRDDTVVDGLPVVRVSEGAELLHSLLTVLYPIPSLILDSYEENLALLAVLQKYNMATVLSTVRSEIGCQLPTTKDAFRAYAIACSKQLIPEMKTAARLTLDHPMTFDVIADALPLFEGSALSDLIHFRKRRRNKLISFFEGFLDGSDSLSNIWFGCRRTKRPYSALQSDKGTLAGWLRDLISSHIDTLQETYANPLPKASSLRQEILAALHTHISGTNCSSCPTVYTSTEGEAFHDQMYRRASKARNGTFPT